MALPILLPSFSPDAAVSRGSVTPWTMEPDARLIKSHPAVMFPH